MALKPRLKAPGFAVTFLCAQGNFERLDETVNALGVTKREFLNTALADAIHKYAPKSRASFPRGNTRSARHA